MRGFDARDQMERYVRWFRKGHLSSTGTCFDIGNTTLTALHRFEQTGDAFAGPTDARSAGNGSIMRLAPVPLYFHPDRERAIQFAGESSRTTHGTPECIDACRLMASVLCNALDGKSKAAVLQTGMTGLSDKIQAIADGAYADKSEERIRGTGYVVESLEAALWCFLKTDNFRDAILRATNLGDDADTTAAVCGQIAGAFYGESGIPPAWLERLSLLDQIRDFADRLLAAGGSV
jgi:ADP-ribosyl-[dinitrogen reductase] hydrolase